MTYTDGMSDLTSKAQAIRLKIIEMLTSAGSGHSAGPLGMADIFATLYMGKLLDLDPLDPWKADRDRIILSAGHLVPVWYVTLALAGYFPEDELETLRRIDSRLQGHPHFDWEDKNQLPGIENTSGPLGQGTSLAVGLALGLRLQFWNGKLTRLPRVISIGSDGELQEGQTWEAMMAASHFSLDNLTFLIDRNQIQIDGFTEKIMGVEPLKEKLEAFGMFVIEIDGHHHDSIIQALSFDSSVHGKPSAIIAHTTPGKGVSFMENLPEWHGKPPMGSGEAMEAISQLRSLGGTIRTEND